MILPTGYCSPKRFVATVIPRTQTFAAARTSVAVKNRPYSTGHSRISTYSGVVPLIIQPQFMFPYTARPPVRTPGATYATAEHSFSMNSASSAVNVGREPAACRMPPMLAAPGKTTSTFVPSAWICCSILCWAPCPIATIAITAPTPMITPSIVSKDRILLRFKEWSATRNVSRKFIAKPVAL